MYSRVQHKHSPTRHGEWKIWLASMNRIALAKLASINFDLDLAGEYKIKSLASMQHVSKYLELDI